MSEMSVSSEVKNKNKSLMLHFIRRVKNMERLRMVKPSEILTRRVLSEYGGIEGLVYHGFKLSTLTPKQREEYFGLIKERSDLRRKLGDLTYSKLMKEMGAIDTIVITDEDRQLGFSLKTPTKSLKKYGEQLKNVQTKLQALEKIMDENVGISKEEFIKQLYL